MSVIVITYLKKKSLGNGTSIFWNVVSALSKPHYILVLIITQRKLRMTANMYKVLYHFSDEETES